MSILAVNFLTCSNRSARVLFYLMPIKRSENYCSLGIFTAFIYTMPLQAKEKYSWNLLGLQKEQKWARAPPQVVSQLNLRWYIVTPRAPESDDPVFDPNTSLD